MNELNTPGNTEPVRSTAAVTAEERRREQDRLRKQRQRERQRDAEVTHTENKAGGQSAPPPPSSGSPRPNPFSGVRSGIGAWAQKMGEAVGPTEARRQLWHIHTGLARVIRSEAVLVEDDFTEAGNAFEEMANHWPGFQVLRLVLRMGAPLILIGALWMIWAEILRQTPWLQEWRSRRRRPVVVPEPEAQPKDPMGTAGVTEPTPNGESAPHPPIPDMNRIRGR